MRKVRIKKVILGTVWVALLALFGAKVTYADDYDVIDFEGSDSQGTAAKCSNFNHGFIYACGRPAGSEGGGASWHVYKIGSGEYPIYSSSVLGNGGASLNNILSTCSKFGYFIAYGWEGHSTKNLSGRGSDLGVLWGPAAVGKGLIASAEYNKYNTTGTMWSLPSNNSERQSRMKEYARALINDGASNNIKLGEGVAEELRREIASNTGREIDMSTGAFCFDPNDILDDALYAKSFVGVKTSQGDSDTVDTNVTNNPQPKSVTTKTVKIDVKESAEIIFSHNVYSDSLNPAYWEIKREGFSNSGFRVVSTSNTGATSNTNGVRMALFSANDRLEDHYLGGPRNYNNGSNYFIWRDVYNVIFNEKGTYTFCENAYVGKTAVEMKNLTRVCTVVQVGDDGSSGGGSSGGGSSGGGTPGGGMSDDPSAVAGECSSFATFTEGTTMVISRVINNGNSERRVTSSNNTGWRQQVYAMPTDNIKWIDCYLPGAQSYANETISKFYNNGTTVTSVTPLSDAKQAAGRGSYNEDEGTYANAAEPNESQKKDVPKYGQTDYVDFTTSTDSNAAWDGHASEGGCGHTTNSTKTMTEAYSDAFGHSWTNNYKIVTTSPYGLNNGNLSYRNASKTLPGFGEWQSYPVGDTVVRDEKHNYVIARTDDVSRTYGDTITAQGTPAKSSYSNDGRGYHPWTCCSCSSCGDCCCDEFGCSCCCCCTYSHTNLYNIGSASDNLNMSESAKVTIPYNYYNTTGHEVSPISGSVVYAGETIRVSNMRAIVNERQNDVVDAKYTTQVDNAEVRLIGYVTTSANINNASFTRDGDHNSNICSWLPQKQCETEQKTGTVILNAIGDIHGHTDYMNWETTYNVFDASAGDYMCFVMAVYPASSGPEHSFAWDTITDPVGDGKWRVSAPKCIQIAKRPSIQILGGDLYVGGSAQTSVSTKQQLYGVSGYGYLPTSRSSVVVNGSWVEEGIVAAGKVSGLSSGASLGYVNGNSRISGGLNYTKFCETRVPLSIANYTTVSNELRDGICPRYDFIGSSDIQSVVKNRAALASYWGSGTDATNVYIGDDSGKAIPSATGKDIRVVESGSNVTIRGGALYSNMMRVVRTSGVVIINGDIENDGDEMTSSGEVPKAVIYAKNIYISCYVRRIDAVLIAENKIVTCDGYEGNNDINSAARSNQLIINGVVMANKIDFGRTFGNSVGNGSGVPAEIINYDTTTLLWGRYMAGSAESDTLTVTYQHELAPRY